MLYEVITGVPRGGGQGMGKYLGGARLHGLEKAPLQLRKEPRFPAEGEEGTHLHAEGPLTDRLADPLGGSPGAPDPEGHLEARELSVVHLVLVITSYSIHYTKLYDG